MAGEHSFEPRGSRFDGPSWDGAPRSGATAWDWPLAAAAPRPAGAGVASAAIVTAFEAAAAQAFAAAAFAAAAALAAGGTTAERGPIGPASTNRPVAATNTAYARPLAAIARDKIRRVRQGGRRGEEAAVSAPAVRSP
jgi:hypothetical protein